ncbi:hypothetical protein GCM10009865_50650 [Aeromicrobium ponti]|uniref:Uncharacterized protein n=1 Tax=Cytobacillus oceanisediminis TaxID=665099 RepID=A0A562J8P2_9BACI|nr:hypothetical protein [Cytobacillus oceanisediminis]TWH79255.1 hypothetical protein IQ19_05002 [Cytobacillus oceanisediminis]
MKFKITTLLSFFLAIIAVCFGIEFHDMMYWEGSEKGIPKTLVWYWIGVGLTYLSILSSCFYMYKSIKNKVVMEETGLMIIGSILNFLTFFFTSIAVIAWFD